MENHMDNKMKTCEDCIHLEVCCYVDMFLSVCDSFKDKSKFIELHRDVLWHGSNQYIEGQLIPHKSFHYEPYVYATADIYYALVRAGKFNVNEPLLKEDYDGNTYTLIELSENAIENIFNTDGYIYVVDKEKFTHTKDCMCNEFISTEPCDIIDTLHIGNILDKMKHYNNFYKFIRYGSDKEKEYWKTVRGGKDGYLQRRKERIQKLMTHKNGVLDKVLEG